MENGIWAEEDYEPYTAKYGPTNTYKETYGPPTS
jgi:hypothetical protein